MVAVLGPEKVRVAEEAWESVQEREEEVQEPELALAPAEASVRVRGLAPVRVRGLAPVRAG